MEKPTYKEMARKLSAPKREPWDNDRHLEIDPEEEIKKAFTKMTNEQLEFHLSLGGKNQKYAQALLDYRKNRQK